MVPFTWTYSNGWEAGLGLKVLTSIFSELDFSHFDTFNFSKCFFEIDFFNFHFVLGGTHTLQKIQLDFDFLDFDFLVFLTDTGSMHVALQQAWWLHRILPFPFPSPLPLPLALSSLLLKGKSYLRKVFSREEGSGRDRGGRFYPATKPVAMQRT